MLGIPPDAVSCVCTCYGPSHRLFSYTDGHPNTGRPPSASSEEDELKMGKTAKTIFGRPALWVLFLALAFGSAPAALAQETTGGIEGVVRDSSGAVLPGATVEAVGTAGTVTTVTRRARRVPVPAPAIGPLQGHRDAERLQHVLGPGRPHGRHHGPGRVPARPVGHRGGHRGHVGHAGDRPDEPGDRDQHLARADRAGATRP